MKFSGDPYVVIIRNTKGYLFFGYCHTIKLNQVLFILHMGKDNFHTVLHYKIRS